MSLNVEKTGTCSVRFSAGKRVQPSVPISQTVKAAGCISGAPFSEAGQVSGVGGEGRTLMAPELPKGEAAPREMLNCSGRDLG